MKSHFLYGILLSALVSACSSSKVLSPEEQVNVQRITQKIENKNYTIEVIQAQPLRGRTINLSYGYDLKIRNDSAYAYLPYFGVAQSAPFDSSDGGIKFASLMKEYTVTTVKNGWEVRFKVDAQSYNYGFFLNIFNNGSSTIHITTYQRDPISFWGHLKEEN